MSDELTNDQISQWLEVAAPCLFAAWQYGQTPDDADPVAWFAEAYGNGTPGPVHAVHVLGDEPRTVAITGNGPRSAAHAKFLAWSSPGNVSKLLRDFRAMRDRAIAAERLLADERAAHAETLCDLDALLTALGAQVTPGGQTLESCYARRVADGMRRARREVPADVEAAIADLCHEIRSQSCDEDSGRATASGDAEERSAARALRAAIAKDIADAERRGRAAGRWDAAAVCCAGNSDSPCGWSGRGEQVTKWEQGGEVPVCPRCDDGVVVIVHGGDAAEIERARAEGRAEAPAAPATVGGLLATAPAGSVVEWMDDGSWYRYGDSLWVDYWSTFEGRWLPDDGPIWPSITRLPARLVPASEADADPASRGPIGGGS